MFEATAKGCPLLRRQKNLEPRHITLIEQTVEHTHTEMAILDFISTSTILWVSLGVVILRLVTNRFKKGLGDIPGPALAKWTRLWKLHSVWKGDHHLASIDLHKKHGSLVRIGPNHISVGDPDAIPIIYGFDKGFTKVRFSQRLPDNIPTHQSNQNRLPFTHFSVSYGKRNPN